MNKYRRRTNPRHAVTTAMYKKGTSIDLYWLTPSSYNYASRLWAVPSTSEALTTSTSLISENIREGSSFAREDNLSSHCQDLDHDYWSGSISPKIIDLVTSSGGSLNSEGTNWQKYNLGRTVVAHCNEGVNDYYPGASTVVTYIPGGFETETTYVNGKKKFTKVIAMMYGKPYDGRPIPGLYSTPQIVGYYQQWNTSDKSLPLSQWTYQRSNTYGCKITLKVDTPDLSDYFNRMLGINSLTPPTLPFSDNEIGDKLSDKVYQQMLSNPVNNLENLACIDTIISLVATLKKLKHGDPKLFKTLVKKGRTWQKVSKSLNHKESRSKLLKELAGGNLAYQYTVKTTLMDIDSTIKAIDKAIANSYKQKVRYYKTNASTTSSEVAYSSGITVSTEFKSTMVVCHKAPHHSFLQNVGLNPNFSNLWDVVPFSFVVNWFFDLGHAFSVVDRQTYFHNNVRIAYSVLTHKTIRSFTSPMFVGTVYHTTYIRRGVTGVPIFVGHGKEGLTLNRLVNGASLIISGGKTPRGE